ncbi:hypothetical protein IFR05_014502 [Cadophora sp. M221]|nr:hypothetical protein IFR05_014502 [Cadophora sp. M221]
MSEPQPFDTEYWTDWSSTVPLDTCYDPSLYSMDLGSSMSIGAPTTGDTVYDTGASRLPDMFREVVGSVYSAGSHGRSLHGPICSACDDVFINETMLNSHTRSTGHLHWACATPSCQLKFSDVRERDAHQKRRHVLGHGLVSTVNPNTCLECGEYLSSKSNLLRHAKELQHQPYGCECGTSFSRLDVLNRHLDSFSSSAPEYPCKYCKRHRGRNGFRRLDHWTQHIRNYHHHELEFEGQGHPENDDPSSSRLQYNFPICPHPTCPSHRNAAFKAQPQSEQKKTRPFATQSAFTKHMRDIHNECTFPCDVASCERVGRRGYFREKDLLKHRREQHPSSPPYRVVRREVRIQSTEPGCDAVLDPSSMTRHAAIHYWEGRRSY